MALPQLSPEQRAEALAKAAAARTERAAIRDQLKSGELSVADILARDEEPVIARMKVSALLESLPGLGKAKAAKIMAELEISESRRVKGLGVRQRDELLERLG